MGYQSSFLRLLDRTDSSPPSPWSRTYHRAAICWLEDKDRPGRSSKVVGDQNQRDCGEVMSSPSQMADDYARFSPGWYLGETQGCQKLMAWNSLAGSCSHRSCRDRSYGSTTIPACAAEGLQDSIDVVAGTGLPEPPVEIDHEAEAHLAQRFGFETSSGELPGPMSHQSPARPL